MFFNNIEDIDLYEKNKKIENINICISSQMSDEKKSLFNKQIYDLEQEIFMTKIFRLENERCILEMAEMFFDIDYEILNGFMTAYIEMAFNIKSELVNDKEYFYANALKSATLKIIDSEMLKLMRLEMKKDLKMK